MSRGRKRWLAVAGLAVVLAAGYAFVSREDPERAAAIQAENDRNFPAAFEQWNAYLEQHPGDDDARLRASRCARLDGDFASASRIIRQANRSTASLLEARLIEAQQGNPDLLRSLYEQFAASENLEHAALVMEAVSLGVLQALNPNPVGGQILKPESLPLQAIGVEAATHWLELRPSAADQAAGYTWRARLHDLVADYAAAMSDFRHALEADPNSFEAKLHYAFSSRAEASPAEALETLTRLHAERPDDALVRLGLANANRRAGRLAEADRLYRELLKLEPDNAGLLFECANVAIDREKPAEAEQLLERARVLAPDRADIWFALSRCMMLAGRTDKANEYRNRYLEMEAKSKSP